MRPLKGVGIKIEVWENPVVYASTRDWSSLYGAIRSEPETAALSSCSHSERRHGQHGGGRLSRKTAKACSPE